MASATPPNISDFEPSPEFEMPPMMSPAPALSTDYVSLDLAELRRIAEAATPGEWQANVLGSEGYAVIAENPNGGLRRLRVSRHGYEDWDTDKANAEHVAAFDPPTVLALIDALERYTRDAAASEGSQA